MSIKVFVTRAAISAALVAETLATTMVPIAHARQGPGAGRPLKPSPDETAAFEAEKPAFKRQRFRRHSSMGKKSKPKALADIAMDGDPFGGHHAHEAGDVVGRSWAPPEPTMPSDDPGGVTGADLARILAQADAYDDAKRASKDKSNAH